MSDKMALRVAIDILHVPSQVRLVRSEPLPRGVPVLLRIAAGDDAAEREAADLTVRSRDVVRRAADALRRFQGRDRARVLFVKVGDLDQSGCSIWTTNPFLVHDHRGSQLTILPNARLHDSP